jgi:hypothetical protein
MIGRRGTIGALCLGVAADAFVQAMVERDARAFLAGWNDVVEAATRGYGGRAPTPRQIGAMLMNLRYRTVFIGSDTMKKLEWANSGRLEPGDRNVAAVAEGLRRMNLLDFGVPPKL